MSLPTNDRMKRAFSSGLDAVWLVDKDGKPVSGGVVCEEQPEDRSGIICQRAGVLGSLLSTLPSGVGVWQAQRRNYLDPLLPTGDVGNNSAYFCAGYLTSPDFLYPLNLIQTKKRSDHN